MKPNDYATYKPATLSDLIGAVERFIAWCGKEPADGRSD
jgi:hypothetical protein